jgi:peptidoglycan/xylan/chitin deacetylase (PgdA/CDA1 family)
LQRLATSPDLLEATLSMWRRSDRSTLDLEDLARYLEGGRAIPRGSLVLTLDDGYVDNWIVLEPMLRHYGFRAIVFVATDFIDPRPLRRPQRGESEAPAADDYKGYLSWPEMKDMESRGTVDIQSHAASHAWYFVSDRIVDYYRPDSALTRSRSRLRFLWLNDHVTRKPFSLNEMDDASVPWGVPVYEFKPSLEAPRFTPHPEEREFLVDYVAGRGGEAFFERHDWRELLDAEVRRFRSGRSVQGELESEESFAARVTDELSSSRRILSQGLGKDVKFLSFPQGGMCDTAERIAREVGYRAWTMPSRVGRRLNRPGSAPDRIYRCGAGYEVFGDAPTPLKLISQRIVLARYSGRAWARVATGVAAAVNRAMGRARTLAEVRTGG